MGDQSLRVLYALHGTMTVQLVTHLCTAWYSDSTINDAFMHCIVL
jgi:hypothetical protein